MDEDNRNILIILSLGLLFLLLSLMAVGFSGCCVGY